MNRKIYYYCPQVDFACGGVKEIYRHIEVLSNLGYSAFVLQPHSSDSYTWFESDAKVVCNMDAVKKDDILVIPEVFDANLIEMICHNNNIVVFNQNCYNTFDSVAPIVDKFNCYLPVLYEKKIISFITVSQDSEKYLQYAFPGIPVFRTYNGIKRKMFYYNQEEKRNQISYMPRKLSKHSCNVINLLRKNISESGWMIKPIHDCDERDTAKIMRESKIFLSFSDDEGFALPPVEAAFCGCIVIGYHGNAGKEYFFSSKQFIPVEYGNIIEFVNNVVCVVRDYTSIPFNKYNKEMFLTMYSEENEADSIAIAWNKILSKVDNCVFK